MSKEVEPSKAGSLAVLEGVLEVVVTPRSCHHVPQVLVVSEAGEALVVVAEEDSEIVVAADSEAVSIAVVGVVALADLVATSAHPVETVALVVHQTAMVVHPMRLAGQVDSAADHQETLAEVVGMIVVEEAAHMTTDPVAATAAAAAADLIDQRPAATQSRLDLDPAVDTETEEVTEEATEVVTEEITAAEMTTPVNDLTREDQATKSSGSSVDTNKTSIRLVVGIFSPLISHFLSSVRLSPLSTRVSRPDQAFSYQPLCPRSRHSSTR